MKFFSINIFNAGIYGEVGFRRSDKTAFVEIRDKLSSSFEEMAFVGDRELIDIKPAHELGISTVRIGNINEPSCADYSIANPYHLKRIFL